MTTLIHSITYILFRIFGFLVSLLSYKQIHAVGGLLGRLIYYVHKQFRKKTMTNLSIAYKNSKTEKEIKQIAIASFQNLTITCLEFFKLKQSKGKLQEIVTMEGREDVLTLMKEKKGLIFLSGHQANWEIPFLAITEQFYGIAVGRPIKNKKLYNWVLSVRQMHGGKIVMPKNAIKEGLKTLKNGYFMGIVGDQAFPESPYSYPLFQTRAWTTLTPALLAYKTGCPIVVGTTKRENNRYIISGSPLLWPNLKAPMKEEVIRLMDEAMSYLEKSIQDNPEQWLWQHDRWKQQEIDHVKREYRYGFIAITLPKNSKPYLDLIPLLKAIYPRSFLTFFIPKGTVVEALDVSISYYEKEEDLLVKDWRYQLLLDFYDSKKVRRHFLKHGAFHALSVCKMQKISKSKDLHYAIKHTLCKKECLHNVIF